MFYLQYSDELGWDYRAYEQYLHRVRSAFPEDLADLVSSDRLRIDDPGTLHDAYVHACAIRFNPVTCSAAPFGRKLELAVELIGRFEDRAFRMRYFDVKDHACDRAFARLSELDAHELVLQPDGLFRHELQFRSGALVVLCAKVGFEEVMLTNAAARAAAP